MSGGPNGLPEVSGAGGGGELKLAEAEFSTNSQGKTTAEKGRCESILEFFIVKNKQN